MVKRKKIAGIFSILLIFIVLCTSIFVPFFHKAKGRVVAEEAGNSLYAFVSQQDGKVSNGKVYVEFGVTLDYTIKSDTGTITNNAGEVDIFDALTMAEGEEYPFETAKIYFRTRNMSAVSELGDYEAIDKTVTVFASTPFASVAVKVNNDGLQVGDNARQFCVEIYKVELTGLKDGYTLCQPNTTREISSKILSTGAEMSIGQKIAKYQNGDVLYNLDLDYYNYLIPHSVCKDVTNTTSFNDVKVDLGNMGGGWYNKIKYLSDHDMLKLGIRTVLSAYEDQNGWYTDNSFVGVQMFGGDSRNVGAPALEGVPDKNVFNRDSVVEFARWFAKFQSDEREDLDPDEAFNGEFEGVMVGTRFDENVLIAKALTEKDYQMGSNYYGSGGVYDSYVGDMDSVRDSIFLIDDLDAVLKGSTTISTRVWKYLSDKEKYYSGYLMFIPTNYRAYVESATFGHIYKDENGKEKIGLSIRFNEPVQFKQKPNGTVNPYIDGFINKVNPIRFNYVSGANTDTLFFEADVSMYEMNATQIRLEKASGFEDIYDFAPLSGVGGVIGGWQHLNVMNKDDDTIVNGWDNISTHTYSCSYDLRKPKIRFDQKIPTTVKTSHTITVRPEDIGETGKLYYGWTTADGVLPQTLSVAPISASGYQTVYSPAGVSGERYLYVYAVSALDKENEENRWYGPYNFDNEAPTAEINCTETYIQKQFSITVNNNAIENFTKYANLKEVSMIVSKDSNGSNVIKTVSILRAEDKLDGQTLTLTPYTLKAVDLGLKEDEYGTFYVSLSISDALGNQTVTPPTAYYFDLRKIFNVSITESNVEMDEFKTGANGESVLGKNYYTIDLSKKDLADKEGKDFYFTLKADDSAISMDIESFARITQSSENVSGKTMYVSRTTMPDGSLRVALQNKFEPGLYRLIVKDLNSTKKSLPIYFYVTNGKVQEGENSYYQEDTGGYHAIVENTVFTNRVFQLPTSVSYYYMTEEREEKKLSYTGGNGPAIFSSWAVALEYIKYCELLDFYAVTLSSDMVKDLNSTISVTNYRKAEGVTQVAEVGQVWIRYKDANWDPEGTTNDWVYYYYSDNESSLPLKESQFSQPLLVALEQITSAILDKGEEMDLVTGEYMDKYGAPNVKTAQMHLTAESRMESMCGTPFESAVTYLGDSGMYLSFDAQSSTSLATNVEVPFADNRRIYYKSEESKEYVLLTKDSRKTFWEYIHAEGKFTILELDENGAREYCIYIDKSAPTLTLTWQKEERTEDGVRTVTVEQDYSVNYNGLTVAGSNCSITNIIDYDTYAYVAIYQYTNKGEGNLLNVYRQSDLNGYSFALENGKYHVQVSDRSGNSYIFILQIESAELTCKVNVVANAQVLVEGLNRDEAEIRRYIVYLNDRVFTTNYNDRKFTESGIYRIFIEDIYGNVYDETYEFIRELPAVLWRYQIADGSYVSYERDNEKINIQEVDGQYVIATSTYLRFLPLDGCVYEIISGNPNPNKNIMTGWVTLNNKTPFTMKVYYELYPETYVMYTCTVDDTAPQVNVLYEKGYYQGLELFDILAQFNNDAFALGDNPFTPEFIGFHSDEQQLGTLYVVNGQKLQSKYFKVQVSDENGVKDVKVYCNDELILTEENDFNNIYVSRRGSYKILATDKFGNTTTFSFVNEYEERVEYFVDGAQLSTDVSFSNYFVDITDEIIYEDTEKKIYKKDYKKQEYGNAETTIKILSSSEIHYLITDEDGNTYHYAFVVDDGSIYTLQYVVKVVNGEYKFEIENISVRSMQALSSGVIAKIDKIGVAISFTKNNDGAVLLTVQSTDKEKKTYTVETRVSSLDNENEMPYYFKTKISTIPSSVTLVDEDGALIPMSQTIKVNKSFMVRDAIDEDVKSVEVAFSRTGNYTTYETVFDGTYRKIVFEAEGMYHVKVVNKYGIQTDYYVIISSQFVMSATVEHLDGTTLEYSTDYTNSNEAFYSNKSVEFIVYATNVKVLDKHEAISVMPSEQGYTIIYINTPGSYRLKVEDEYGNRLEKDIYIEATLLEIDDDVLIYSNEKALRRDENYTNQKVLINKSEVYNNDIAFIRMLYGEQAITIYDNVSEDKTAFDETQFVGLLGDGKYTLIFKDCYGNKAETVIYYCGTPTLSIMRRTLNGIGEEPYSLEKALADGVWTNDSVNFVVSATEYVLTVDGMSNVTSIAYANKTKDAYEVYYLDEYGFEYTFTVHLHREDVVIAPAESMSIVQLSDLLVTKDSVQIVFTENAHCSYSLNNGEEITYDVDDVLYKDGIYRFKVVDIAGNVSTYTVKKDSAVEYRLEGSGVSETLINGGVTNSHSVKFFAENADNAYIKKVFHNNVFIPYEDEIFTERGKWELIVADDAGNESYFRFYILYGKMDGFTYNTPYNYVITSVTWEVGNSLVEAIETIKEQGLRLEASENGKYTVTMQSSVTGNVQTFTFTIDKTPPQVQLIGCQPNEKTINNITLKGCAVGDTVYVYKEGKLIKTTRIDSDYMDPPTISEAGKYKIVIENEAGIQIELSFERKFIPNVAGSVLIIVLALVAVIGLFVGLIWRNHSKTDD